MLLAAVHRLGQTRPVRCVRLVMKDSLEHRMINLQDAKAALGKGSIERLSTNEYVLPAVSAGSYRLPAISPINFASRIKQEASRSSHGST